MTEAVDRKASARRARRDISKSGYYKMRLQHTLTHTKETTRLIYVVNGAIGGGIYFVLKDYQNWEYHRVMIGFLLVVLALVNLIHGQNYKDAGIVVSGD